MSERDTIQTRPGRDGGQRQPTTAELTILRALWDMGPSTVRAVHQKLNPDGKTSYTTTLKLLQIMHQKGLVERDDSSRAHVYMAANSQQQAQHDFVADLAQRLFNGSAARLALQALGQTKQVDPQELAEIRRLIENLEGQ